VAKNYLQTKTSKSIFFTDMKMNLSAKGRKLLGAIGLGRSDRGERRVTDPDGGSTQSGATLGVGFSKSDEIMNTRTNTLWCKSLALLALTFALASPALGQISLQWGNPSDIVYGTILDGTQLNARAVDANGNDVPGTFRYSWNPPAPPVGARDGETNVGINNGVTINQRELTLQQILDADADSTVNGRQDPDWRFLDVGNGQTLSVTFTPTQLITPLVRTVQINVLPKTVTVFPQALQRNFGEENYPGYEFGLNPVYTNGNPVRNANNELLDDQGNVVMSGGNTVNIASINPDGPGGYARTGAGLFFDGFVRGETYPNLAASVDALASVAEQNGGAGGVLVTQNFRLLVRNGANDIFRVAPVGTSGTVTFGVQPAFKNYVVSIGGSGSLTVKKATIRFEGARLVDGNSKTFGNNVALVDGNGTPLLSTFRNPDFSIANNFRLGEANILDFITPSSTGAAATAAQGSHTLFLTETPPNTFDINILRNNYDLQLVNGTINVNARNIQLSAFPSNPPAGFDPGNTSGFNFKLFGDVAQPPTFAVVNPAPHHLINGAQEYNDPRDAAGPIANTYHISQLKGEAFDALPTVVHTAEFQSVPGFYPINISGGDGQGSNYNITARNAGNFEVRRAYLVIQTGNATSFLGAPQATVPLTLLGVRSFDQVLNADGSMNVNSTLDNILLPGTPKPQVTVNNFVNNPAPNAAPLPQYPVNFTIVINNPQQVRARNYDVYFNDGRGAINFLNNGTNVAVDGNGMPAPAGGPDGRNFANFLFNIFNPNIAGGFNAMHPLFRVGGDVIGRYSVDVVRAQTQWNTPAPILFGTDLSNQLNARFINPDTGLELDDARNVPQLVRGTHYHVRYFLKPDGQPEVSIASTDNTHTSDLTASRLLKAGKTHRLRVQMVLTNPGMAAVQAANRQNSEFEPLSVNRDLVVNVRTLTAHPREAGQNAGIANNPFGTPIPNSTLVANGGFWDLQLGGIGGQLTAAQLAAELNFNDVVIRVLNTDGNPFPFGNTTATRGDYISRASGLKATNGNLNFQFVDGTYTVTPIPVVIQWNNNLPGLVYGDAVPDSVRGATIQTPGVAAEDGSIVYTPDPLGGGLIPDTPNQQIKAKWVPSGAGSGNFGESNEITRQVNVAQKSITVAVRPIDRIFGDATPDRSLLTPINDLLIPKDNGRVTVNFDITGNGADSKAPVAEYPVTPNFVDNQNRLQHYAVTIVPSRIKVSKRNVTVTPVSRTMEVGQNATDFVDNWEANNGVKPSAFITFEGLASFHEDIRDNRGNFNTVFGSGLPNGLELDTNSPTLPSVGQTFSIFINQLGNIGARNGASLGTGNYNYTLRNDVATLSVVEQKIPITFNNVNVIYGQPIGRSGDAGPNGAASNKIKALNATSNVANTGFTYTFVDSISVRRPTPQTFPAGTEVPEDIILPAGNYKIRASTSPAASEPNFASNTKDATITVAKRDLNIRILDSTVTYGDADLLFFDAEFGTLRRPGESNGDYNNRRNGGVNRLVNGDTPGVLDQQLILISNAEQTSPAGTYFIRPAQTAEDRDYNIRTTFGSQRVFDGIIRDANNPGIILVNVGPNTDGIGAPVSLTNDFGPLTTFNPVANGDAAIPFDLNPNQAGIEQGFLESFAGELTVQRAPLNVTARDLSKTEGDANPPFAFDLDPAQLRNGDTAETVFAPPIGRNPLFNSSVTTTTGPGSFPIEIFGSSAANYIITHVNGTFNVLAPPAPITWAPDPSTLAYGTGLGAGQLNASSTVDGTFDYSANPLGAILGVGSHNITTTFTPTDLAANRVTEATATIEVTAGLLTVTADSFTRGFNSPNPDFTVDVTGFVNGEGLGVIQTPITVDTSGIDGAPAGTYDLIPAGGTADNYTFNYLPGVLTVTKEPATITLSDLNQTADGTPRGATVTVDPSTVNVDVTYNGSPDVPSAPGTYEVRAIVNDPNFEGFALGTLTLNGEGTITLANLSQTFTGNPISALVTTNPEGLPLNVTYNGRTELPVNAGTYEVRAIVSDPVFSGFAIDILVISPAEAVVSFDLASLDQPANNVTGATVTTDPAGLNVDILYGGSSTLPSAIGSVDVLATVTDPNYIGTASAVFSVGKNSQTITTPVLPSFNIAGQPIQIGLFASSSIGLPVSFELVSGSGSLNGSILTVTQPGDVVVAAVQGGDDTFAAARAEFTVNVTGQGVASEAPKATVAGLTENGLELGVSGSPGATVSILRATSITGSFTEVMSVTLDANGQGSATVPTDGEVGFIITRNN